MPSFRPLVLAALAAVTLAAPAAAQVTPLANAHAHNDYEHARPLLDALDNGFCSVEADIYLVEGELLVAHDRDRVRKGRTLQSLYLDPLRERVRANGGRVYRGGSFSVTLLVDIKGDSGALYPVLRRVLSGYSEMLTRFTDKGAKLGAVTVILSGDRPIAQVAAEKERLCGIDGRPSDLDATPAPSPSLYPLVSQNWSAVSSWKGEGDLPAADKAKVADVLAKAHRRGIKVRFWATPDTPAAWGALRDLGVDYLNTDDLPGLRAFLLTPKSDAPSKAPAR
jgi:hypothetical protein